MNFKLTPLTTSLELSLSGSIEQRGSSILLVATLEGDLSALILPKEDKSTDLWKHTCLELFLGSASANNYYEFNFSPTGTWNHYLFEDYRKPISTPPVDLSYKVRQTKTSLSFEISLTGHKEILDVPLSAGISAVIESSDQNLEYWALNHPNSEKPDFHDPRGWLINL